MDGFQYCRVCLVTDVKMFSLETSSSDSIGVVYSQLVQIPIFDKNQHVCFECASLLLKFQEFKSKCLRAHHILSRVKYGSVHVIKQTIKNIDRKINKLESNLKATVVSVEYEEPLNEDRDIEIEQSEDEENKGLENSVKVEATDTEIDEKSDFEDVEYLDDFNEDFIDITEETIEIEDLKTEPVTEPIKEPQTKKRKLTDIESESDFSDDEPLSKSMSKSVPEITTADKNLDFSYFDDYATVVSLTPEDARNELLLRKKSDNYITSPFKCELCYRGYGVEEAFDNHTKKHSVENGDYECNICYLRFPKKVQLCKHTLSSHKRKFICKLCPYICFCVHQAKNHVSLHKGKKYPCNMCKKIFSMPNSLMMHKRKKHLKESVGEFVCELCGDIFASPRGLYVHNRKVHRQVENQKLGPKCEDCNVHFTSELAWKRHLVLSSKHIVINGCKLCGETFSNSWDLKVHKKVHSQMQIKKYSLKLPTACRICDTRLLTRMEYNSHMSSEHPNEKVKSIDLIPHKSFVCEVCGKMFKQQCFLTYHQRTHTGERPYKCNVCDKAFHMPHLLAVHHSVHNRKGTHQCHICASVVKSSSALSKHMKLHLDTRPHKCAICDRGFVHLCEMKQHIKYVHDKVPWPKKKKKKNIVDEATNMEY